MDNSPDLSKQEILHKYCSLNPHPDRVRDELFATDAFYDPRDMLQVKYEMLRRVRHDKCTVSTAASDFGFSRVSFYQIRALFEKEGLGGLLPQKRGPKERHKLTREVMLFIHELRKCDKTVSPDSLAKSIEKRFAIRVHPRSVQRALSKDKKKHRSPRKDLGSDAGQGGQDGR